MSAVRCPPTFDGGRRPGGGRAEALARDARISGERFRLKSCRVGPNRLPAPSPCVLRSRVPEDAPEAARERDAPEGRSDRGTVADVLHVVPVERSGLARSGRIVDDAPVHVVGRHRGIALAPSARRLQLIRRPGSPAPASHARERPSCSLGGRIDRHRGACRGASHRGRHPRPRTSARYPRSGCRAATKQPTLSMEHRWRRAAAPRLRAQRGCLRRTATAPRPTALRDSGDRGP